MKKTLTRKECLALALREERARQERQELERRHLWKFGCRVCEAPPPRERNWSPFCYQCGTHWTAADKEKPR